MRSRDTRRKYQTSKGRREQLWRQQNGACFYCGRRMILNPTWDAPLACTIDHLIPVSENGKNHNGNTVGACRQCNGRRGSMPVADFKRLVQENGGLPPDPKPASKRNFNFALCPDEQQTP